MDAMTRLLYDVGLLWAFVSFPRTAILWSTPFQFTWHVFSFTYKRPLSLSILSIDLASKWMNPATTATTRRYSIDPIHCIYLYSSNSSLSCFYSFVCDCFSSFELLWIQIQRISEATHPPLEIPHFRPILWHFLGMSRRWSMWGAVVTSSTGTWSVAKISDGDCAGGWLIRGGSFVWFAAAGCWSLLITMIVVWSWSSIVVIVGSIGIVLLRCWCEQ